MSVCKFIISILCVHLIGFIVEIVFRLASVTNSPRVSTMKWSENLCANATRDGKAMEKLAIQHRNVRKTAIVFNIPSTLTMFACLNQAMSEI